MESKFSVSVVNAGQFVPEADENFAIVVTNRKGRKWVFKKFEACPGNAGEHAMVLEEFLNDGGKLDREQWFDA